MQPPTENVTLAERVRALAEEAVAGTDLYVVDVEVRGRTGSRVVEVYVDADAGAGLDALTEVSNRLGFLLDAEDPVPGHYTLNVSSPDASRPLALPRQYPKHVGRDLEVTYADGDEVVSVRGTLQAAGGDAVTLEVSGQDAPTTIPYDAIREARVLLPW